MRTIKTLSIVTAISINLLLIPTTTFASWWNPLTWFSKKTETQEFTQINTEIKNENFFPVPEIKKEDLLTLKNGTTTKNTSQRNQNNNTLHTASKSVLTEKKLQKNEEQKCLNGLFITANETCKKTCPNGEIVAEKLKCNDTQKPNPEVSTSDLNSDNQEKEKLKNLLKKYNITEEELVAEYLYDQWMNERSTNTGRYSLPTGVQLAPDQIMGLRTMADDYYSKKYNSLLKKAIISRWDENPVLAQKKLEELENNNIIQKIDSINSKLNSINSKQNQIQGCIKDLANGSIGYGCN